MISNHSGGGNSKMDNGTKVVFECEIDSGILNDLKGLRQARLKVLRGQLQNLSDTISMLDKGGLAKREYDGKEDLIQDYLQQKIKKLEDRIKQDSLVFYDEIDHYLMLLREKHSS